MNHKSYCFIILMIFFVLHLSSCSLGELKKQNDAFTPNTEGFEVQSVAEQLKEELNTYPTKFVLPVGEGKESLERAFFFFKTYTSRFTPRELLATEKNISLSNEKSGDKTLYRVSRVLIRNGFRYTISSSAPNNPKRSAILAANLARFIKEGKLEVNLLTQDR